MILGYNNYLRPRGKRQPRIYTIIHSPSINTSTGFINVGAIHFPKEYIGKKVRIKIEFVEEKEEM